MAQDWLWRYLSIVILIIWWWFLSDVGDHDDDDSDDYIRYDDADAENAKNG